MDNVIELTPKEIITTIKNKKTGNKLWRIQI